MKKQTKKNRAWFIRVRGSYLPNSGIGWLTYIPYVAYTVGAFIYVFNQRMDAWISMLILVPNWVAAASVMHYIAANHSH